MVNLEGTENVIQIEISEGFKKQMLNQVSMCDSDDSLYCLSPKISY